MVTNFPGPYQADIFYTTLVSGVPLEHVAKLNVDCVGPLFPGQDFSTIEFVTKGAGPVNGLAAILDWADLMKAFFHTANTIDRVELWSVAPESYDRTFISAADIGVDGTNVGATIPASQVIFTFRTSEGGIMRLNLMEASELPGRPQTLPNGFPTIDNVANFVVSDNNWILGRDTSYPVATIRYLPGQNEKLFKFRFGR